jgi:hypothetical protein
MGWGALRTDLEARLDDSSAVDALETKSRRRQVATSTSKRSTPVNRQQQNDGNASYWSASIHPVRGFFHLHLK